VGKQLVSYGHLMGCHVPAVGFVQHWYWIQLLKPIFSIKQIVSLKIWVPKNFYVPPLLKSLSPRGRILIKSLVFFIKRWMILWLRRRTNLCIGRCSSDLNVVDICFNMTCLAKWLLYIRMQVWMTVKLTRELLHRSAFATSTTVIVKNMYQN